MQELAREVATRYGSGFYGPQPKQKNNPVIEEGSEFMKPEKRKKNPARGKLDAQILAQLSMGIDTASRDEIETAYAEAKHASSDMARSPSRRRIYKQLASLLRAELKKFGARKSNPRQNPVKKKHTKKARSPAQRANDKRLGEMARKRAAKRNPTKPKEYIIFNVQGNKASFLHATNQWSSRKNAMRTNSKPYAVRIAKTARGAIGDIIGVADDMTPTSAILRETRAGKK